MQIEILFKKKIPNRLRYIIKKLNKELSLLKVDNDINNYSNYQIDGEIKIHD